MHSTPPRTPEPQFWQSYPLHTVPLHLHSCAPSLQPHHTPPTPSASATLYAPAAASSLHPLRLLHRACTPFACCIEPALLRHSCTPPITPTCYKADSAHDGRPVFLAVLRGQFGPHLIYGGKKKGRSKD
ncbi:hypothetical protein SLEP1_g46829 [Rubroshorea leprosula]|uniref:Uncharacterized protein n=1 Tax=Rubroshorea leprosula TaxID=152421 RepID=A0AAV5LP82_9ROSI|nr:hypothetical protein SLEP1_g46829 [Rubroshorea leprosula]